MIAMIRKTMIIAPAIDGRLIALNAETGKPIWEARVAYPQDQQTITMAPRIANDKVIVGVSGGDGLPVPVPGLVEVALLTFQKPISFQESEFVHRFGGRLGVSGGQAERLPAGAGIRQDAA